VGILRELFKYLDKLQLEHLFSAQLSMQARMDRLVNEVVFIFYNCEEHILQKIGFLVFSHIELNSHIFPVQEEETLDVLLDHHQEIGLLVVLVE